MNTTQCGKNASKCFINYFLIAFILSWILLLIHCKQNFKNTLYDGWSFSNK